MIPCGKKDRCCGCNACKAVCPMQCIEMERDEEGFLYPVIDEKKCIQCGKCERSCPVNKEIPENKCLPKAYGMISKDDTVRKQSSSGGIFSLFAKQILKEGGIVYGAAYDDRFKVKHIRIESEEELYRLRGSKYVQSELGSVFPEIKELLEAGRIVFFTGTPCQVGGLKAYLNKSYNNLVTMDLICHGVPSPLMFEKYISEKEQKAKLSKINFRDKISGWKKFSVSLEFENGVQESKKHYENEYMWFFLKNYTLRPSCYQCAYKHLQKDVDITVADFWKVENIQPELYNDDGVSLVLTYSEKAENLLKQILNHTKWMEVDLKAAIKINSATLCSPSMPADRSEFWIMMKKKSFLSVFQAYYRRDLLQRIWKKFKKLTGMRK